MDTKNLLAELEHELGSTEQLIELVPSKLLNWQPHAKAMTLGQLAYHTAVISGRYLVFAQEGSTEFETLSYHHVPKEKEEITECFSSSVITAKELLGRFSDKNETDTWHLTKNGVVVFSLPLSFFIRLLVFNHLFHHRGQLSSYLRILNIPLPSIYGPSADFNPFF